MFYFEVKDYVSDEVIGIFSSEIKLNKNDVVVVADNYNNVVTSLVTRQAKTIEALSTEYDVEPIIIQVDIKDWKARQLAKVKKQQLMRVMNEKMNDIKTEETLAKYAGKDKDFADLLEEYRALKKPILEESEEESA